MNKPSLSELLRRYAAKYNEPQTVELLQCFLTNPEILDRPHRLGHVTGSAWLVNKERSKAFLVHHRKLDIWVQPGGHVEQGETVVDASRRECMEESGITDIKLLDEEIFDIDIHHFPARGNNEPHYHYDVRFIFEADSEGVFSISDESHDGGWFRLDEIAGLNDSESITRMAVKAQEFK